MNVVLTLPVPVSVNAMFADGKTRRHKSQRYADWVLEAGYALNSQKPPQIKGQYHITYAFQEGQDRRERDAFNLEKGCTDLWSSMASSRATATSTCVRGPSNGTAQ
jgi:hypothetical protein